MGLGAALGPAEEGQARQVFFLMPNCLKYRGGARRQDAHAQPHLISAVCAPNRLEHQRCPLNKFTVTIWLHRTCQKLGIFVLLLQMPRLTAMLRAFATDAGALNVDDLYLERQKILQRRKAQKQQIQVRPKSAVVISLGC